MGARLDPGRDSQVAGERSGGSGGCCDEDGLPGPSMPRLAKRLLVVGCGRVATPSSRHPMLVGLLSCWLAGGCCGSGTPLRDRSVPSCRLSAVTHASASGSMASRGDGDVLCAFLHRRARGSVTYVTRLWRCGDDSLPKAQARTEGARAESGSRAGSAQCPTGG